LAEILRQYSVEPSDSEELYRRMLFNLLIGNTDDHGRNHALLLDLTSKNWSLSPAYDMVPVNNSRQHAMGLGDFGRVGSIDNALSQCSRFGLKLNKARQIVAEAEQVVLSWPQHFIKAGVSASDIEVLKALIPH
jgi:serine/threonine-protein kinase HipA